MHHAGGNSINPWEDEGDDDFPGFAPLDPEVELARQRLREAESPPAPFVTTPEPIRPRLQFGLVHLFVANTVLAIVLALLQVMAPDMTAAALGLAAFIALIWDTFHQPEDPRVRMAIHGLLFVYVAVSLIAFVRMAA